MKYLIIFLLFFVNTYPQQWVQQNVNPYSFLSPQKVTIVNDSTWFINTSGTLLRTTDAGINFTTIVDGTYPNKYAFEFFFFNKELKVCLYDPPHAKYELVTSTDMGNLFQTTNTYLPLNGTQWIKINFTDELHGYTLESYANDDTYSITSDGGKTWNANQLNGLCDIHFIDKLNGIMSVQNTNYLYRTTNGGTSWYKIFFPDSSNYSKNYFTPMDSVIFMTLWRYKDVYHKFEFGSDNLIKLVKNPFPEDNPNALYLEEKEIMFNFYSPLKIVYISTNSGKLWYKRNAPDISITYYSVLSDKSILAFGRDLSIYRSYDIGITWHCLTKPSFYLRDVHILNEKFSLIAGSNILKTTNGGINWDIIYTNFFAHKIYALSKNNFISYAKYTTDEFRQTFGSILQSFDSGTNWDTVFTTYQDLDLNIYFKDSLNGFIYGPKTLLHTIDGGITWETNQDTLLLSKTINSISFASNDVGFIATSENGFRTEDGGKNWFIDDNIKGYYVQFIDAQIGFVIKYEGLFKSNDGGKTFTFVSPGNTFSEVKFIDELSAFWSYDNNILKTTNGGLNWSKIFTLGGSDFVSMDFYKNNLGWAAGESGEIWKYTDEVTTYVQNENVVNVYSLSQNYPNPFNPATTIRYSIPKQNFVSLKVYDVLGNEVAQLVNEEKTVGEYEVTFNASGLSSGVYFYRINSGEFSQVKKLLLLK